MTADESLRWEESARRADRLRASPPMFRSRFLDCFTRVHPAVPPLLHGPVVLLLLAWAVRHTGALLLLVYVLLGYGVWTLTEYWVHRALFHFTPRSAWGRRAHWMVHGVHHDHPNDPRRLVMPPRSPSPAHTAPTNCFTCWRERGRARP